MPNNKLNEYQQWITDWLTARKDIFDQNYKEAHPYRSLIPGNSKQALYQQLRSINNTRAYIGKTGYDALKKLIGNNKIGSYQFDNFSNYDENSFGGKNGFAKTIKGIPLIFLTNKGAKAAGIHEYTHNLVYGNNYKDSPQDIKIAKILSEDPNFKENLEQIYGKYKTKDSKGKDVYIYTPDEVYARLMQLRHDFRFDPNHKWTTKEVSQQRKKWGVNGAAHYYFDKGMSDETLTKLLNEVAYIDNSTLSDNQTFYAKKGTKLLKRSK